jgi:hypothetical protein
MRNERERDYRDEFLEITHLNGVQFVEIPFNVRLKKGVVMVSDVIPDDGNMLLYAVAGCGNDVRGVVIGANGLTHQIDLECLEKSDVHIDPARNHLVDFSNGEPDCDGLNYVLASYNQITDLLENRLNARRIFQVKLRKSDVMLMVIFEDKDTGKIFYEEISYEWLWLSEEDWTKLAEKRDDAGFNRRVCLNRVVRLMDDAEAEVNDKVEYLHYLELKAKYENVRRG